MEGRKLLQFFNEQLQIYNKRMLKISTSPLNFPQMKNFPGYSNFVLLKKILILIFFRGRGVILGHDANNHHQKVRKNMSKDK